MSHGTHLRAERSSLVEGVRRKFMDGAACGVLLDWEREYGDPHFADWCAESWKDFEDAQKEREFQVVRGAYHWRKEFWPIAVSAGCHKMEVAFGKKDGHVVPQDAPTPEDVAVLPLGCAYLQGQTWDVDAVPGRPSGMPAKVRAVAVGGMLSKIICPAAFWYVYGPTIAERTPVRIVNAQRYKPATVRHKSGGNTVRFAWFNDDVPRGEKWAKRLHDPSRLPADVFRLLPGVTADRVVRYDDFDEAMGALSAALLAWALRVRDEEIQRLFRPQETVQRDP